MRSINKTPWIIGIILLLLTACNPSVKEEKLVQPDHKLIYPSTDLGDLFVDVQMSRVFPDSKTFVDCIPKRPVEKILEDYHRHMNDRKFDLKAFVEDNFEVPAVDLSGKTLDTSNNMASHVIKMWDYLTRQADDTTQASSLIPLPNPYVVPGGRFREIYYWDSYFTMVGLSASDRLDLVKDMLDNFAFLINQFGFIPNGNRAYFLSRSQPPFFSSMVMLYAQYKGNDAALEYLPELEKEYKFWMDGLENVTKNGMAFKHVVKTKSGEILNRYWDNKAEPRPEAYREDVQLAEKLTDSTRLKLYRNLRSAAESGWDFSSRWFGGSSNLIDISTTDILPVDLNCLLYHLESTISALNKLKGDQQMADEFEQKAAQRKLAIVHYFWDDNLGCFTDYNFVEGRATGLKTLAAGYPLYYKVATEEQARKQAEVLHKDLLSEGGLLTTFMDTGQQWDKPNGWAPLQWINIKGLQQYGFDDLAKKITSRWLRENERVYANTGKMMEKYNVTDTTIVAGGGEYPNQDGFGWTNGVAIALIKGADKY